MHYMWSLTLLRDILSSQGYRMRKCLTQRECDQQGLSHVRSDNRHGNAAIFHNSVSTIIVRNKHGCFHFQLLLTYLFLQTTKFFTYLQKRTAHEFVNINSECWIPPNINWQDLPRDQYGNCLLLPTLVYISEYRVVWCHNQGFIWACIYRYHLHCLFCCEYMLMSSIYAVYGCTVV